MCNKTYPFHVLGMFGKNVKSKGDNSEKVFLNGF